MPADQHFYKIVQITRATHLGDAKVPLQLIMAKTRHKNPRTAMRYIKPGGEAVAEITGILGPSRRKH
jgi:hypothetical protein